MLTLERYGPLAGRVLMALIFLVAGYAKLTALESTAGYIASRGLPVPMVLAIAAGALELGGGLLLVVGWMTRWVAAALLVFCALTALSFHPFWSVAPQLMQGQMVHFMKNVAMMGGLLYMVVHGSGPLAIDWEMER